MTFRTSPKIHSWPEVICHIDTQISIWVILDVMENCLADLISDVIFQYEGAGSVLITI